MKLEKKNINHVSVLAKNGVAYSWTVSMGYRVSDSRQYVNYRDGKTTDDPYPIERLPKTVQAYIHEHRCELINLWEYDNGDQVTYYRYR